MISIAGLRKRYGKLVVFDNLNLEFPEPEVVAVLGPSGCGKTTLLNLICGIDEDYSGRLSTQPVDLAYMMQEATMLPWRSLIENATLGLEIHGTPRAEAEERVDFYMRQFEVIEFAKLMPSEASGGIIQRVSLIRQFALHPSILLLDEPFSSLDFDIKLNIQQFIIDHCNGKQALLIFVTHDIEDAISISDRIVVLAKNGSGVRFDEKISLRRKSGDVVSARKHLEFGEQFSLIWEQLRSHDHDQVQR